MASYPSTLVLPDSGGLLAVEDVYRTPAGFRDIPYIYWYDGSGLTNGANYTGLSVPMDGEAEFILRSIFGFSRLLSNTAPGTFRYRTKWGMYTASAGQILGNNSAGLGLVNLDSYPVLPERSYPPNGYIIFDLTAVLNTGSVLLPGLGFLGVKRMPFNSCFYDTPYKYREVPFSYETSFTLGATGTPIPQRHISVIDYDFELQRILITAQNATFPVAPFLTWYDLFAMTLYDNAKVATSSAPIPYSYIYDNQNPVINPIGPPTIIGSPGPRGLVHPVPSLVYQINGHIQYDIVSLVNSLDTNLPYTIEIVFQGVNRVPCG